MPDYLREEEQWKILPSNPFAELDALERIDEDKKA